MTTPSDSSSSELLPAEARQPRPKWLKMSAVAAGSALAGGLAVAWYYRKTLTTLRHAEMATPDPDYRIQADHSDEDT
jgi:hypothetical protein